MLFNVPQFIDIEDKIVGPLTAKQLGWVAVAGILILIAWGTFDTSTLIVIAIIICAVFGALAFYKPYNQPLLKFIISGFHYLTHPKMYVWKRYYDSIRTVRKTPSRKKETAVIRKKVLNEEKVKELSKILDMGKRL